MTIDWKLFASPEHDEVLAWFRSGSAGRLRFDLLHPVAQDALTIFHDQFVDPFPRVESHGNYIFGVLAASTSIEDDRADFYTVHFVANFEQIVTILRSSNHAASHDIPFDLGAIGAKLAGAADSGLGVNASVGMAIAKMANVIVTELEVSLDNLKRNVQLDLELVTSESRQIPSDASADYLSELYRRTAIYKTEVVSLRTLLQETKNVFKSIASDEVDVRRDSEDQDREMFPPFVEVVVTDLLMRTRHLTSIRNNLESDLELMFERFQEIQNSQQTAVGRRFTGVLSILLLPQLIAGYFGQNFDKTPGYRADLGLLYSLGLIVLVSLVQFYYLKRKKYF